MLPHEHMAYLPKALTSSRYKVAEALVGGKVLRVEGVTINWLNGVFAAGNASTSFPCPLAPASGYRSPLP